ncbi:Ku protein [Streptomyces sp. NPDC000658]|uniref:Ku protein n=1 Tax=Streptomyces sp. NPDC000658 TaxID=3154266 RepID=UPI0033202EB2
MRAAACAASASSPKFTTSSKQIATALVPPNLATSRSPRFSTFDEDAILEPGARTEQGHKVRSIEIEAFVPLGSVDPIRIAEGYYLAPDGQVVAKPYKLLRQALERSSKVAVAKLPCRAASAWACSGCEGMRSSCTRCVGRTRSATPPSCFRRRWRCPRTRSRERSP